MRPSQSLSTGAMTSKGQVIETPAGSAILVRRARKTLAISVLPNGVLELVAPDTASEAGILAKVEKRRVWIERQRREFLEMNAMRMPRRYVSGATHRYLGRQYRLKISSGDRTSVRLRGACFEIVSLTCSKEEVQKQLEEWFREKARAQFGQRLRSWNPWCARHGLPEPRLSIRRMAKRWGSASSGGRIVLNPELIHAPSTCIDYVIAHEVCHLKHPSHSPAFFRLLSILSPGWREVKKRLEQAELS